jgi:hypothetical protein
LKLLQFTKDREIGVGAEDAFQLGQIGDLATAEMLAQDGWLEGSGSHNVRVLTPCMG